MDLQIDRQTERGEDFFYISCLMNPEHIKLMDDASNRLEKMP